MKTEGLDNLPPRPDSQSSRQSNTAGSRRAGSQHAQINAHHFVLDQHQALWTRSVTPHHRMKWADVVLIVDAGGKEFIEYNEGETRTRSGLDPRNVRDAAPRRELFLTIHDVRFSLHTLCSFTFDCSSVLFSHKCINFISKQPSLVQTRSGRKI